MGDAEAGEFEYGKYEDVGAIARQGRDRVKSAIAARQRAPVACATECAALPVHRVLQRPRLTRLTSRLRK